MLLCNKESPVAGVVYGLYDLILLMRGTSRNMFATRKDGEGMGKPKGHCPGQLAQLAKTDNVLLGIGVVSLQKLISTDAGS